MSTALRSNLWVRKTVAALMVLVASLLGVVGAGGPLVCGVSPAAATLKLDEDQAAVSMAAALPDPEDPDAELALWRQTRRPYRKRAAPIDDLVPEVYRDLVRTVADRYQMDARILAAVGTVESQWYSAAVGSHGDSGLMQILPETASWIADRLGFSQYDLRDPLTNLTMGAWYLDVLHTEYGSWEQALAVYNGGPRAAPKGADHPYTVRVLNVYGHPFD